MDDEAVLALYGADDDGPELTYKQAFWARARAAGKSEAETSARWAEKCRDPEFRRRHGV